MDVRTVILVAGRSVRMQDVTNGLPKSFLDVGGKALIDRNVDSLHDQGVTDITLVVGYRQELFRERFPGLNFVVNPDYATTNTAGSLYLALSEQENKPVLVLNGDVYLGEGVFQTVLDAAGKTVAAVKRHPLSDEEVKVFVDGTRVTRIGKYLDHDQAFGEAFGVYLLSPKFATYLKRELYLLNNPRIFYEAGMDILIQGGHEMTALDVGEELVMELDFPEDYRNLLNSMKV